MGSFFFFLFKPFKNLVYWRTELTTILIGIIIISVAVILISNFLLKYKRNNELILHTSVFWGSMLAILGFLLVMCFRNSNYLYQEGGLGSWLTLIFNGLILGVIFNYFIYFIYSLSSPLRKNFIYRKMKTFFIF